MRYVIMLAVLGFGGGEAPPQAPPVNPRFDARLENIEARLSSIENKIDKLADKVSKGATNCRCTDCPKGGNCEDCDCPTFSAAKPAFPNLTVPFGNLPTGMICGPDGCKLPERAGTVCGPNGCSQPSSSTAIYSGSWTPTRQVYRRGLFGKWRRVK